MRNSISFLVYLTPSDWSDADGGALRVFEEGALGMGEAGEEAGEPRHVLPVGGTLVLYDSALEHEVLPTRRERHLLSGRYRELDGDWQRRRGG